MLGKLIAVLLPLALAAAAAALSADIGPAMAQSISPKIPKPVAAHPRLKGVPLPKQVHAKLRPLATDLETLVPFDMSPFPFDGVKPNEGLFLNVIEGGRRGHTGRGGTYWEDTTYSDRRVLLYLSKGFDIYRPAVMVVFFHGNGARLDRDVIARQRVPAQIAASGLNAVLVAPQFAVDALDSSAGSFWQPGTFRQFLDETTVHLVELYGDERTRKYFSQMPVVMVAYSGGYNPAAYSLAVGGADARVRGVVLLDALYDEIPKFSDWVVRRRDGFFLSSFTASSAAGNAEMRRVLAQHKLSIATTLGPRLTRGSVTMLPALPDAIHNDYVTHAFVDDPIKEVLLRLPEFRKPGPIIRSNYRPPPLLPPPGSAGIPVPEPAQPPPP